MPLVNAMKTFFTYAADEINKGPTPDPAEVAGSIPLNMPRSEVHKRLRTARKYIDLAIEHEKAGECHRGGSRPPGEDRAFRRHVPDRAGAFSVPAP